MRLMPSLFVDVACGEYVGVLSNILGHVGIIMDEQSKRIESPQIFPTLLKTPGHHWEGS